MRMDVFNGRPGRRGGSVSIEQLIAYSIIAWGAGLWLVGWLDGGG
ncbi:hypothetical protein WHEELER_60 [Mycobacterium phage Wheeler]|nr:hypothetical protein WHEELER_60 [Mycobacterium phage Wheeler]AGT13852.1 hypothetical protein WHEELER_60 [Mycobacterium phage Wheeler]